MSVLRVVLLAVLAQGVGVASAWGQGRQFGDWQAGMQESRTGLYAATMNDSKGILGQYCFFENQTCYWLLASDIDCNEGAAYPVLINGDSGAASHEINCIKIGGKPRYAFTDFERIDEAVRSSKTIGFAFPLKSGRFQVSRFSLSGSVAALDFMRSAMQEASQKTRGTRDQTL